MRRSGSIKNRFSGALSRLSLQNLKLDSSGLPKQTKRADRFTTQGPSGYTRSAPSKIPAIGRPQKTKNTRPVAVITDLDQTVIPIHEGPDSMPAPFPGIVKLLHTLDERAGKDSQDIFYVTARSSETAECVPAWLEQHNLPVGALKAVGGDHTSASLNGKLAAISKILNDNPDKDFVLFGDSSHIDAETYRTINELFPGRIKATFINDVKPIEDSRLEGMERITNYAQAASKLRQLGVLDRKSANAVINNAISQGLKLTKAERYAL